MPCFVRDAGGPARRVQWTRPSGRRSALTKKRFPDWRPKALLELLEVAAVVCLEELMGVKANEWVSEGGAG